MLWHVKRLGIPQGVYVLLACGQLLMLPGCETSCDVADVTPHRFSGGLVNSTRTEYQTSTWAGPFLEFPPGRVYELEHGLGRIPTTVKSYVAFSPIPLPENGSSGNVAESAGNQVIIQHVGSEFVRVTNDSCQLFYLRIVVGAAAEGGG